MTGRLRPCWRSCWCGRGRSCACRARRRSSPSIDPFSDERIIVKLDLRKITDEGSATGESLADNILFRRASADSFSDLYCPILYREYVVGYIHLSNHRDRREKIGEDLVEYT